MGMGLPPLAAPDADHTAPAPGGFHAWTIPEYRWLWGGVAAANSGRWVLALGVGWLLYNLTHSSFWVGASFFCIQGPALVIAPLVGVLADRRDRRTLLVLGLALSALATAALAAMATIGVGSPWPVLAATLCCGVAFSIQGTSWSALIPAIVPRRWLANANAWQGTARQGAEFLGPALASPLLATAGPRLVFALASACYVVGLLLVLRIRPRPRPRQAAVRPFTPLLQGLRYVRAQPVLACVVLLVACHCSLTMTYQGMLPQFADELVGGNSDVYGGLMTMVGLGAVVGTLALALFVPRQRLGAAYAASALLSGAALALLGLSHWPFAAFGAAILVGAAQASFMAISLTYLQEVTADAYLGRVTGVYNFLASGTMAFLSWGLASLAGALPAGAVMVLAGSLFVAALAAATLRLASVRQLYGERGFSAAAAGAGEAALLPS